MLLIFSKVFYTLFIFYVFWFQIFFFPINSMTLILGGGMILFLLLHEVSNLERSKVIIPSSLVIWIVFSFYILLTGFFLTNNINHLFSSWITYFQNIVLILYIINVSKHEGSNDFFQKTFWVLTVIYLFTFLFWGIEGAGGRVSISETSNPIEDGLVLLLGVFFTLFYYDNSAKKTFFSIVLVSLYTHAILLTGSRTSFIALVILVLAWMLTSYKNHWKKISVAKRIFFITIVLALVIFLLYSSIPFIRESALYERLIEDGDTNGDIIRIGMYEEAFQFFEDNPLFGIGFNQFEKLSVYGVYSHSTYAEILSTTGIFGTILYIFPYFIIIYKLLNIYLKFRRYDLSNKALQYLILMFLLLILGTVRIHFYEIIDSIVIALMISFYITVNMSTEEIIKRNVVYS